MKKPRTAIARGFFLIILHRYPPACLSGFDSFGRESVLMKMPMNLRNIVTT
jgi:hypothetical protein